MAFHLHKSNKIEILAEKQLVSVIRQPCKDPMKSETIIVQNQGMAAYLKQQIAGKAGIACNIEFPFLNNFINEILEKSLDSYEDYKYFLPDIMVWKIFGLLQEFGMDFPELKNYLNAGNTELKKYQLAGKIAQTFDQYQIFRPAMIMKWEKESQNDSKNWQIKFWQALSKERKSRTKCFREFLSKSSIEDLKEYERISIFGIFTMPPILLALFKKIAEIIDVHFFYFAPSRREWDLNLHEHRTSDSGFKYLHNYDMEKEVGFSEDTNPLLNSLGKMGREFFSMLSGELSENDKIDNQFNEYNNNSLLCNIQAGILDNTIYKIDSVTEIIDKSIGIHNCHSKLREIETLYDNLHRFIKESDLAPRDIMVLTPDISAYTPYIKAVFDRPEKNEKSNIPYTISDNSVTFSSRIIGGFLELLKLPGSKFKASQVLDLLEIEAIHNGFDISETDLEIIRKWIAESGIRWGIDGLHRCDGLDVVNFDENSWRAGMDRMLLGFAMPDDKNEEERLYNGILPYDPIEGNYGKLLGNFLYFINSLFQLDKILKKHREVFQWCILLNEIIDDFFQNTNDTFNEIQCLRNTIEELKNFTAEAAFSGEIGFDIIQEYFKEKLQEEQRSGGFFRGKVTFCTMQPMRNIPADVVCLLGMNEGEFPRQEKTVGFNMIYDDLRLCDRSQRYEDRYLFLEALLSAREYFYISYIGQDIKTNESMPPATSVSELLDYIDEITNRNAEKCLTKHKLHRFDRQYFIRDSGLFSFSGQDFSAAKVSILDVQEKKFLHNELSINKGTEKNLLTLSEFLEFFYNPAKFFTKNVLQANLDLRDDLNIRDSERFSLDSLENYKMNNEILHNILLEEDRRKLYKISQAEGILPVGIHGKSVFENNYSETNDFIQNQYRGIEYPVYEYLQGSESLDVDINVKEIQIIGKLDFIKDNSQSLIRIATMKGKDAIGAWVKHLVFTVFRRCAVETLCFVGKTTKDRIYKFPPISVDEADQHLQKLVKLFHKGYRKPLPFFCNSSYAYVKPGKKLKYDSATNEKIRIEKVRKKWFDQTWNKTKIPGERQNSYIQLYFNDSIIETEEFRTTARIIFSPFWEGPGEDEYRVEELKV